MPVEGEILFAISATMRPHPQSFIAVNHVREGGTLAAQLYHEQWHVDSLTTIADGVRHVHFHSHERQEVRRERSERAREVAFF
jgi:hypothetical protein